MLELPEAIQQAEPTQQAALHLGFLSRIEQKKGLELLFDALAEVSFSFKLSIAGTGESGYVEALKQLAIEKGISQFIDWPGWLEGDDKIKLLSGIDALVLTSHNENFANVVIEALALGTAVLISKQVGLSDFVEEQHLGWTCELSNDAIVSSLNACYENSSLRKQIKKGAPALIRQHFSSEKLVPEYIALYQQSIDINAKKRSG